MRRKPSASRGMALIAVLWMVAAMGLIVTGLVKSVRTEISSGGMQRQAFQAQAHADAAILMAMQVLYAQTARPPPGGQTMDIGFQNQNFQTQIKPLNGLIDINRAPIGLLIELYKYGAGLTSDEAQLLAQLTLQTRELKSSKGQQTGFDSSDDLLRVPGMTYERYVMIRDLVTADLKGGNGLVNPQAAPRGVLQVLVAGDTSRAAALSASRITNPNGMDTTFFNPAFIDNGTSRSLRFKVDITLPGGGYLTRWWDVHDSQNPRNGLPWRILGKGQRLSLAASFED